MTSSLTTLKPSHCRLRKLARYSSWSTQLAITARRRYHWTSKPTLSAAVEADHTEHSIRYPGRDTVEVFFNNMSSRRTETVGCDRAVLSGIVQIVTPAVQVICASIVSRVSREFPIKQSLWHQVGSGTPVQKLTMKTSFEFYSLLLNAWLSPICCICHTFKNFV